MNVLLVSGSTRPHSTNTAALRTAALLTGPGALLYDGLLQLPAFVPEALAGPEVLALRQRLDSADAVLFCTPEYAGSLPGSLKNLLDWTVGTGELYGKPVAFVTVAAPGRGLGAEAHMTQVLAYVGARLVVEACLRVHVARDAVGADGLVADEHTRQVLSRSLTALEQACS